MTKAVNVYLEKVTEAQELIARISQYIEDIGEVAPDDVTWAHVGSMGHVAEELAKIAEFIKS